ncbi:thiamine-phosphate kinase [Phreatobacter sp.]|uniref:thiamine-phosphate kinase n=1 Tax=Phreatobacter sp. TaxID=1966341 RepID=UPI00345CE08B
MTRPTEDELIARYLAPLAVAAGADGLSDDAAALPEGAGELVVTKDMAIAGVHFFPDDPPAMIAAKALRTNLSDLAAKGAAPAGFLLGLGLPQDWTEDFLAAFCEGLAADIAAYACPLYGGDTVKVPGPLTISITAFGRARRWVRRRGAQAGDVVCVTGTIGDGALGLAVRAAERDPAGAARWIGGLTAIDREHLRARYLLPQPRTALAEAVAAHASAAMDVSDGLAGDLAKLLKVSGVGAHVEADSVPLSDAARSALALDPALLRAAFTGGDDYEILLTCRPDAFAPLEAAADAAGVFFTRIGEVAADPGLVIRDGQGNTLDLGPGRFEHF